MQDPRMPSVEEVEEHEKTHLPYRSWCKHCVAGRGTEHPCRKGEGGGEVPEFLLDWAFPGEEEAGKTLTMLVARMGDIRMTLSTLAPSKSSGEFVANRVLAFLKECGCEAGDIIIKADQEPAVVALLKKVARSRAEKGNVGRTMIEHSNKYCSKSNMIVDRAMSSGEEQMRTMN